MARVTFLGLDMEDTMRAEVVSALRALFPEVTAAKTDGAAIQAVLRRTIIGWLREYRARQAVPNIDEAMAAATRQVLTTRTVAAESAETAGLDIIPTTAL